MKKRIGKHSFEVERPDKTFFPTAGITKQDLMHYYRRISEFMLPHMKDRPVTMHRYPDGIKEEGFYQKEVPDYFPEWIETVRIKKKENGVNRQLICNNTATLVYLASQACITPHLWLSRKDRLENPDKLVFDLDPPKDNFEIVRKGAFLLKTLLEELKLSSFVMTTGSEGLHVVVALDQTQGFDEVRAFSQQIVRRLADQHPEKLTVEQRKNKRKDRLFLDVMRNAYAQTSVTPYAVRAREGAPIATPLNWEELKDSELGPRSYTVDNIFQRLAQRDDPWKNFFRHASSLGKARQRLENME